MKAKRWSLPFLLALSLVCVLAMVGERQAGATLTTPSISLHPSSGAPGSLVTMTGNGFLGLEVETMILNWDSNEWPPIGYGPYAYARYDEPFSFQGMPKM